MGGRGHKLIVADGGAGAAARGPVGLDDQSSDIGGRGPRGLTDAEDEAALEPFKRAVREAQIEYLITVKKRSYFADLSKSELDIIEGKHRMRKEAAQRCRELLAAARAKLAGDQSGGNALAGLTRSVGVQSAYRSIAEDAIAWENTFTKHYRAMAAKKKFAGNALGLEAQAYMFKKMRAVKAPPGYSNHSNGMAVDFKTSHDGVDYAANTSQNDAWKETWLHKWLVTNARNFGFDPLSTEAWHWDYVGKKGVNADAPKS